MACRSFSLARLVPKPEPSITLLLPRSAEIDCSGRDRERDVRVLRSANARVLVESLNAGEVLKCVAIIGKMVVGSDCLASAEGYSYARDIACKCAGGDLRTVTKAVRRARLSGIARVGDVQSEIASAIV